MSKRKTLGRVRKRDERRKRGPAADARRPRGPVRERKREDYPEFEGTVQMTREGFCFVLVPEDPTKDIFVGSHRTRGALHGDRVRVAVTDEIGRAHV